MANRHCNYMRIGIRHAIANKSQQFANGRKDSRQAVRHRKKVAMNRIGDGEY